MINVRASSTRIESTSSTIACLAALVHLCQFRFHIVAQIIKPKLVVGRISHITTTRRFLGFRLLGGKSQSSGPRRQTSSSFVVWRGSRSPSAHAPACRQRSVYRNASRQGLTLTVFISEVLMQEYACRSDCTSNARRFERVSQPHDSSQMPLAAIIRLSPPIARLAILRSSLCASHSGLRIQAPAR
jgi:hypothetical protein